MKMIKQIFAVLHFTNKSRKPMEIIQEKNIKSELLLTVKFWVH